MGLCTTVETAESLQMRGNTLFIVGQLDGARAPTHGGASCAGFLGLVGERQCRPHRLTALPGAEFVQPATDVRGRRDVEALQEVAAVEHERVFVLADAQRLGEDDRVAPGRIRGDTDLIPASLNGVRAEVDAKKVQRSAQRGASVLAIVLRPEQRQQRVPTVEAPLGKEQIKKERQPFGLAHDGFQLGPVRSEHLDFTQHP